MSLDWVIVGGGIHGVHVATRLLHEGGVEPRRLRIVDPGPRLLHHWWARVEVTGMSYMRSPSVHHLGTHPYALRRFARRRMKGVLGLFAHPYERPAVDLFRAHCDHVIERFGLADRHLADAVVSCEVAQSAVRLRLVGGGHLGADRVVLALGSSGPLARPEWAPQDHPRIQHVFREGFDGWPASAGRRVAVVGGGITAAQVALRLARSGQDVHLISRRALREQQFDTSPGWLGPKYMTAFERTSDLGARRAQIADAREGGSIPEGVLRRLRVAIQRGKIALHEADIAGLEGREGPLRLRLRRGSPVEVDDVLLATGFSRSRPGGRMIEELVDSASLPCAPCGFPVVDSALRWHPRIHVSGPLAELELGPAAPNIAGGRRAADRILTGVIGRSGMQDRGDARALSG